MEYARTPEGLDLVRDGETVISIPVDGELGILYEPDDVIGGTLLKHGDAENVRKYHQKSWGALMQHTGLPREIAQSMEFVSIPVASVTPEVLEEVNACLAISGRVGRLRERLEAMADTQSGPRP